MLLQHAVKRQQAWHYEGQRLGQWEGQEALHPYHTHIWQGGRPAQRETKVTKLKMHRVCF